MYPCPVINHSYPRHMALNELATPQQAEEDSDDDDDYYYGRQKKKPETHEWVFLDEFNRERFRHDGDTIVPGAGMRGPTLLLLLLLL